MADIADQCYIDESHIATRRITDSGDVIIELESIMPSETQSDDHNEANPDSNVEDTASASDVSRTEPTQSESISQVADEIATPTSSKSQTTWVTSLDPRASWTIIASKFKKSPPVINDNRYEKIRHEKSP